VYETLNAVLASNDTDPLGIDAEVVSFETELSVDPVAPCTPECGGENGTNPATCVEGTCVCNAGLEVAVEGTDFVPVQCREPLCEVNNGGCDSRALCTAMDDVVICECPSGFDGDGFSCKKVEDSFNVAAVVVPLVVVLSAAVGGAYVFLRRRRLRASREDEEGDVSPRKAQDMGQFPIEPSVVLVSPATKEKAIQEAKKEEKDAVNDQEFEDSLVELVRLSSRTEDTQGADKGDVSRKDTNITEAEIPDQAHSPRLHKSTETS